MLYMPMVNSSHPVFSKALFVNPSMPVVPQNNFSGYDQRRF